MTKSTKWLCAQQRSESSLCAQWVAKGPSFLHADSEDSDQTGRMPRLILVFTGHTVILLVMSWGGSFDCWLYLTYYCLHLSVDDLLCFARFSLVQLFTNTCYHLQTNAECILHLLSNQLQKYKRIISCIRHWNFCVTEQRIVVSHRKDESWVALWHHFLIFFTSVMTYFYAKIKSACHF